MPSALRSANPCSPKYVEDAVVVVRDVGLAVFDEALAQGVGQGFAENPGVAAVVVAGGVNVAVARVDGEAVVGQQMAQPGHQPLADVFQGGTLELACRDVLQAFAGGFLIGFAHDFADDVGGVRVAVDVPHQLLHHVQARQDEVLRQRRQQVAGEGKADLFVQGVVFGIVEDDAVVPPGECCRVAGKRRQFAPVVEDEAAEGKTLADVVQDGGEEDGVGPEVALVFLLFFAGKQRQFVLLPPGQRVFQHFQGVHEKAARHGMVVCLRGGGVPLCGTGLRACH